MTYPGAGELSDEPGPGLWPGVPLPENAEGGADAEALPITPVSTAESRVLPMPERRGRFEILGARAIITMPPPSWWLEGLLPMGGLAVLYGPPGCGKSFLALAWAVAMATGRPWHGRKAIWSPAAYLAAEGAYGLSIRLNALLDAHELDAKELDHRLAFVPEAVNLLDFGAAADLAEDLYAHCGSAPGLLVVDTLPRAMIGGDENSVKDISAAIAGADTIRRGTNGTALLVHHTQKVGELERGSSALRGAADTMLSLRQEDDRLLLEVTKQRNSAPIAPLQLRLVPSGASCIVEPAEGQPPTSELSPTRRTVLQVVDEVQQNGWAAQGTIVRVAKGSGVAERTGYRALHDLHARGYLDKNGTRYALSLRGRAAMNSATEPVAERHAT